MAEYWIRKSCLSSRKARGTRPRKRAQIIDPPARLVPFLSQGLGGFPGH